MKTNLFLLTVLLLIAMSLAACQAPPTQLPTIKPVTQPSNTALPPATPSLEPTPTTLPTATLEPTPTTLPTATPDGRIFRDDFNGSLQPGWRWDLEDPTRWSFVDVNGKNWLQFIGTSARSNVLMRDIPSGNFAIIAHVKASPYLDFHQANIFVFQDTSNFVAVNTGYCQPCPVGGYGYFMETISTGAEGARYHYEAARAPEDMDVYLKIDVVNNVISGYFATTLGEWTRIGRFGNFYNLTSIGLSATNMSPPSGTPDDIVAQFDFFEVTLP